MTREKRLYVDSFKRQQFEPVTEPAIRYRLREDLYIVYAGSVEGTEEAVYRFTINPLVAWVWIGGVILVFGGVVTLWPGGGPSARSPRRALEGYQATLEPVG
jgi:cytochrome c-type biogenesis protein CcmF